MALAVTTDHDAIRAALSPVIERDPVRGTVLGTIATTLDGTAWCATARAGLAVRSSAAHPLGLTGVWDDAEVRELAGLARGLGDVRALSGEVGLVDRLAALLFGEHPVSAMNQLLFRLDVLDEPAGVTGTSRLAGEHDRARVRRWYAAFAAEADAIGGDTGGAADRCVDGGHCHLWCDGASEPVSMAGRRPVIAGSARIGPVYTPPAHRGRGYGAAVTAAATRSVLDDGAVPVLFTDLANPTSNKIYRRLGYQPVEHRKVVRLR